MGDIIYLYNPSRKPKKCYKFHKFWTGHFKVNAKISQLNYEIISTNNKKQVVHINRMKPAYDAEIWKPKDSAGISSKQATRPNKRARRKTTRRGESEEDEVRIGPFPLLRARPQIDQVEPRTPPSRTPDTPDPVETSPESPRSEGRDPSYEPSRTPRSRRELQPTRMEPPLTRARAKNRTRDHDTIEA
jgi:hypothetical protein